MIVVSLLLILVAVTLLTLGLAGGSSPLLISSIVASLLAAVALVIGARQAATQRLKPVPAEEPPAPRRAAAAADRSGARRGDPVAGSADYAAETGPVRGDARSDFSGSDPILSERGRLPSPAASRRSPDAESVVDAGRPGRDGEPGSAATHRSATAEPDLSESRRSADDGPSPAGDRSSPAPEPDFADDRPAEDPRPTAGAAATARPAADGDADDDEDDFDGDFGDDTANQPMSDRDAHAAGRHDADAALAGDPAHGVPGNLPETSGAGRSDDDDPADEPPPQPVRPADAVRVARMDAEVLVVDGRPRYHLGDCPHLAGRGTEPLPVGEAVELGFSPCGECRPVDRLVAQTTHR